MNATQVAWRNHYCRRWADPRRIDEEPNDIVARTLKYKTRGRALDLGAGAGPDAIYLARNGFAVDAVEMSCTGVDRMNRIAKEEHLPLIGHLQDACSFDFFGQYDLIVSVLVFNHFADSIARLLIEQMKLHTAATGLCVIETVTKAGDSYRLRAGNGFFYPDPEELRSLFTDWEAIEYDEVLVVAEPKVWLPKQTNNVQAQIIAKKPVPRP